MTRHLCPPTRKPKTIILPRNCPGEDYGLEVLETLAVRSSYASWTKLKAVAALRALESGSLGKCALIGSLPDSVGSLQQLRRLQTNAQVFRNYVRSKSESVPRFGGSLPDSLWSLSHLVDFSTDLNCHTGSLSALFSGVQSLAILDLRHNRFSGKIPEIMP
eukprot:1143888-Amphidinium_carterae.1